MFNFTHYWHLQKQCSAPNTVTRIRDESIIVIPSTLAFMDSGNRRSTVSKDVRPKTKNRNSSTKRETKKQNGTVALPLKSGLQQRADLPTGDETAYDTLQNCCQCRILLPLPILNEHQVLCSPCIPNCVLSCLGTCCSVLKHPSLASQCVAPPVPPSASVSLCILSAIWFVSPLSHWVTFEGRSIYLLCLHLYQTLHLAILQGHMNDGSPGLSVNSLQVEIRQKALTPDEKAAGGLPLAYPKLAFLILSFPPKAIFFCYGVLFVFVWLVA